ncbi:MAG TPA: hypothetical protein VGG19_01500 [Tepidisphaeraceae bacterium]
MAISLAVLTSGCTTFKENYYVGMFDPTEHAKAGATTRATVLSNRDRPLPTQLYRYRIDGTSLLSDTRFEAGLYDARAVDQLFGEVKDNSPSASTSSSAGNPSAPGNDAAFYVDFRSPPPATTQPQPTINVSHAKMAMDISPVSVVVSAALNLTSLHANKIIVTVDAKSTLKSVQIVGIDTITCANSTASPLGNIAAGTITGAMDWKLPGVLSIAGGHAVIVSSNAALQNGVWTGTAKFSQVTGSNLCCTGGNFQIHGGTVHSSLQSVEADGSLVTFDQPPDDLQLNGSGVLSIYAVDASVSGSTTFSSMTAKLIDGYLDISTKSTDNTKLMIGGKSLADVISENSSWTKDSSTGMLSQTFASTSLNLDAARAVNNAATGGEAIKIAANQLQSDSLVITPGSGAGHLTNAGGEQQSTAITTNTTVTPEAADPNRHTWTRYGPEGTAVAQTDSERMVVFMSSDPRAITDKISAFVKSQQTQQTVAAILSQPKQHSAADAQARINSALAVADQLISTLQSSSNVDLDTLVTQFIDSFDTGK